MNFLYKILITTVNVFILAAILPGIRIENNNILIALIVALVLAVLNAIVKPLLVLLTLPVTIFSLGLFLLVINAIIILLGAHLVHGFYVNGFWPALLFSLVLSFFNSLVNRNLFPEKEK